jgi:hypothetical protein
VAISLERGQLQAKGWLSSGDGRLSLDGTAHPFLEAPEFRVEKAEARDLNLGGLIGKAGFQSRLNLDASFAGSGSSMQTMEASGNVVILPSALNQGTLEGGGIALHLRDGRGTAQGEISISEGGVALRAEASLLPGSEGFWAEVDLDAPELGGLLGREEAEVAIRGSAAMTWQPGDGMGLASQLEGWIGGAAVDTLTLRASLANQILEIETLRLRS